MGTHTNVADACTLAVMTKETARFLRKMDTADEVATRLRGKDAATKLQLAEDRVTELHCAVARMRQSAQDLIPASDTGALFLLATIAAEFDLMGGSEAEDKEARQLINRGLYGLQRYLLNRTDERLPDRVQEYFMAAQLDPHRMIEDVEDEPCT